MNKLFLSTLVLLASVSSSAIEPCLAYAASQSMYVTAALTQLKHEIGNEDSAAVYETLANITVAKDGRVILTGKEGTSVIYHMEQSCSRNGMDILGREVTRGAPIKSVQLNR